MHGDQTTVAFCIDALFKLPDGKPSARRVGEYPNSDEAMAAAKHMIDSFLFREFRDRAGKGITADALYAIYTEQGERPLILRLGGASTNVSKFNALKYAKARCEEICATQ